MNRKSGLSTPSTIVVDEEVQRVSGRNHESFSARVHDISRRLEDDYDVQKSKVVGSGYSGPVKLGISRITGKKVAIKSFNKMMLTDKRLEFLRNEVSVYLLLDHPNVARLLDIYEDEEQVHIVMEYCSGKELYHRLVKKSRYSEKDAARTTYEMLIAVNYLHQHSIVHRDIKLENFLYEDASESAPLKLIDFGFSRVWHPIQCERLQASCGSIQYVSPEVLRGNYDSKCDMWSLGVIVFMLLSGHPPFGGSEDEVLEAIRTGSYSMSGKAWKHVSDCAKDFVRKLLEVNVSKRMSASDALNHPWILQTEAGKDVEVPIAVLENLRDFSQQNHLRRAVLSMLAYTLTSDELSDLHEIFLSMDQDKEGTIQLTELVEVMRRKLNITEAEIGEIFGKLDRSNQGKIEYTTFLAATMASRMRLHKNLIRKVFTQLDADHDGQISLDDLRTVLGPTVDGEDIKVILDEADADGDGRIDFDEFERCFHMIGPLPTAAESEVPPPMTDMERQKSMKLTLAKLRAVSALSRATKRRLTCDDTSVWLDSVTPSPLARPIHGQSV